MPPRVLQHHPRRFEMTNELHARPFVPVEAPGRAIMLAFKETENAAERDPERDRDHLIELIDRHGGAHPAPGANHHSADLGRFTLKWERHTEFISYVLVEDGERDELFDTDLVEHFPQEWLESAPGAVVAAVEVEIMTAGSYDEAIGRLNGPLGREFAHESLVVARVLDDTGLACGDFRVHEGGFTRFALILYGECASRRIGRAVQRLIEIENYRMLSMLALPIARETSRRLNEIERQLTALTRMVADAQERASEQAVLDELTALSAEIEAMAAGTAFRFGAARAYEAIVLERIQMMREERIIGRQLFSEFMLRRYDPAMRTCRAVEARLNELATRASRIADLLRTRVDVAVEAQNQRLLRSMDARAKMQLRLQETVEGLSVVAISYYAVSLAAILLAPFGEQYGIDKTTLSAAAAVPVILGVALMVRRIRRRIADREE